MTANVTIKILKEEQFLPDPKYHTDGSSGIDIASRNAVTLLPRRVQIIETGIRIIIPKGYEGLLSMKSGQSARGLIIANSPGKIDSDYRGEIKLILANVGNMDINLSQGERVAQLTIQKVTIADIEYVTRNEYFEDVTDRGAGGLGSTGV